MKSMGTRRGAFGMGRPPVPLDDANAFFRTDMPMSPGRFYADVSGDARLVHVPGGRTALLPPGAEFNQAALDARAPTPRSSLVDLHNKTVRQFIQSPRAPAATVQRPRMLATIQDTVVQGKRAPTGTFRPSISVDRPRAKSGDGFLVSPNRFQSSRPVPGIPQQSPPMLNLPGAAGYPTDWGTQSYAAEDTGLPEILGGSSGGGGGLTFMPDDSAPALPSVDGGSMPPGAAASGSVDGGLLSGKTLGVPNWILALAAGYALYRFS